MSEENKKEKQEKVGGQDLHQAEQMSEKQVDENVDTPQASEKTDEKSEKGAEADKSDAEKLADAEAQIVKLKDQLLRQMAEFDNFRKRTIKEKTDLILNGGQKVVEVLLPVLDDLERAKENMDKSDDVATLKEGVDLVLGKLMKALAAQGLKRMETDGAEFDTDFHEAIALTPAQEEQQKNHIIDCVQPGYLLNEKVIRHAKVVVAK